MFVLARDTFGRHLHIIWIYFYTNVRAPRACFLKLRGETKGSGATLSSDDSCPPLKGKNVDLVYSCDMQIEAVGPTGVTRTSWFRGLF